MTATKHGLTINTKLMFVT